MNLSFLSAVFLLGAVFSGMMTAATTHSVTSDGGTSTKTPTTAPVSDTTVTSTSVSSSNNTTSSFTSSPPSTTEQFTTSASATTTENGTTESITTEPSTTSTNPHTTVTTDTTTNETTDIPTTQTTTDATPSLSTVHTTTNESESTSTAYTSSSPASTRTTTAATTHSVTSDGGTSTKTPTTAPVSDTTVTSTSGMTATTHSVTSDGGTSTETPTTAPVSDTTVTSTSVPSGDNITSFTTSPPSTTEHITTTVSTATTESTTMKPSTTPTTTVTTSSSTDAPSPPPSTITTTPPPSTPTTRPTTDTTTRTPTIGPSTTTSQETTTTNPPVTTAPSTTVTIPVIVCPAVPCPPDRACLESVCQCRSGTYLQNDQCVPAQVFPGELHLTSLEFKEEMKNRSSGIFQETAKDISAALYEALKDVPGYQRSEVVRLERGSVRAIVNNIFENTNATEDTVKESIEKAINESSDQGGLLTGAGFTREELCDLEPLPCESISTNCNNQNGWVLCTCKSGYINNLYSNTSCVGCPSGQEPDGDKCKPCKFGYGGFNCQDSSPLAVVVVSCVLGGILLILVLAMISYYGWRRYSRSKRDDSSSPYSIGESWPAGVVPIPRATTKRNAARSMEMIEAAYTDVLGDGAHQTNGGSGSYDLSIDGMRTFKGKNPSRYSYLVQGHENPYYLEGDEKTN